MMAAVAAAESSGSVGFRNLAIDTRHIGPENNSSLFAGRESLQKFAPQQYLRKHIDESDDFRI